MMNNPLQTYRIDNRVFTTPRMIQVAHQIPVQTIEAAIHAGQLEATQIGSRVFVEVGAFEAYRAKMEEVSHAAQS